VEGNCLSLDIHWRLGALYGHLCFHILSVSVRFPVLNTFNGNTILKYFGVTQYLKFNSKSDSMGNLKCFSLVCNSGTWGRLCQMLNKATVFKKQPPYIGLWPSGRAWLTVPASPSVNFYFANRLAGELCTLLATPSQGLPSRRATSAGDICEINQDYTTMHGQPTFKVAYRYLSYMLGLKKANVLGIVRFGSQVLNPVPFQYDTYCYTLHCHVYSHRCDSCVLWQEMQCSAHQFPFFSPFFSENKQLLLSSACRVDSCCWHDAAS